MSTTSRIPGVGRVTRGRIACSVTLTEEMTRRVGGHTTRTMIDGRDLDAAWRSIERAIGEHLPDAAEVEVYAASRYGSSVLRVVTT